MDRYDVACYLGLVVAFGAWVVWIVHGTDPSPPKPAVISLYRG